jgi:hypothetical protein
MTGTKCSGAVTLLLGAALAACTETPTLPSAAQAAAVNPLHAAAGATRPVAGSAIHFFTTAVIHSQEPTETGMIQRSTDVIVLSGDLQGYILYHPTSTFDHGAGTLVNTGTQIFSGTIAGSDPVILLDDSFRFVVDLATGETVGHVRLRRSKDAPHPGAWWECDLVVVGTGMTADGDAMVDYTGACTPRGGAASVM